MVFHNRDLFWHPIRVASVGCIAALMSSQPVGNASALHTGSNPPQPKLSLDVVRQRQDAIDRLRQRAGEIQNEQDKRDMLATADRWQQSLDAQR